MHKGVTAIVAAVVCVALLSCSKQASRPTASLAGGNPKSAQTTAVPLAANSPGTSTAMPVVTPIAQTTAAQATGSDAAQSAIATAAGAPKIEISEKTEGPFQVNGQAFTFIKHIQKIAGSKSPDDSTVEWWELRDANGKAAYRVQYGVNFMNGTFEETEDVDARELKTKFGQGILVDGESLPSAPDTGSWVQVFGLFNGKLVPFGAPISIEGDFTGEDVDSFQPSALFRGEQPRSVSRDVLNFRLWTGNFNIHYAVAIDWMQGSLRPAWTCMQKTSTGPSSACRYKVEAEASPRSEETFIRLFSEPDPGFTPRHVVVKPESKIEFVEAEVPVSWNADEHNISFGAQVSNPPSPSDAIWLHIKVDGQDGWISGEEDFEAVGLPQAG